MADCETNWPPKEESPKEEAKKDELSALSLQMSILSDRQDRFLDQLVELGRIIQWSTENKKEERSDCRRLKSVGALTEIIELTSRLAAAANILREELLNVEPRPVSKQPQSSSWGSNRRFS